MRVIYQKACLIVKKYEKSPDFSRKSRLLMNKYNVVLSTELNKYFSNINITVSL